MDSNQKTIILPPGTPPKPRAMPSIPDHRLLKIIGGGSYGEVWLAQNVMSTFRAVKIVYRETFQDERPYEREFAGIKKFEPLSRSHAGLMDILQIGRNDAEGYFYYVMELADDQETGQDINPETYNARTLWADLRKHTRLPFADCLRFGLTLSSALGHLHKNGLLHRDIKPANIIFVNGLAQLADIGLVADASEARTFVGTEGYIPPEGPGTAQADIYSLGKVFYEIATGKDRLEFPELPPPETTPSSNGGLTEFNEIISKAAAPDIRQRYQNCDDLYSDLVLLESGKSLKHLRAVERRLRVFTRIGVIAALLVATGAITYHWYVRQSKIELRREAETQRREAEERRKEAKAQKTQADLLQKLVDVEKSQRLADEQNLYFRDIALAQSSWTANNVKRANKILDSCPKQYRNWEWNYLRNLSQSDRFTFRGHTNGVNCVAFNSQDNQIASADAHGTIKIWDAAKGIEAQTIQGFSEGIVSLAFSPDGQRLAASSDSWSPGEVKLWSVRDGTLLWTLPHLTHRINNVAFSPDGTLLATGDEEGFLHIWNAATGKSIRKIRDGLSPVQSVSFSHDSQKIATGSQFEEKAGTIKIWPLTGGSPLLVLSNLPPVYRVKFSPDDTRLAAGMAEVARKESHILRLERGQVKVWDAATGSELQNYQSRWGGVQDLAFSPDGKRLAMACGTGMTFAQAKEFDFIEHISVPAEIVICDLEARQEIAKLRGHSDDVTSLSFSPDGRSLASASLDHTVKIWDPNAAQNTFVFTGEDDDFIDSHPPSFSVGQRFLAVPRSDGKINLLDILNARTNHILPAHSGPMIVAFGNDHRFASAGMDHAVKIWDASHGRELFHFSLRETEAPSRMAFSPDGKLLALALNGTILKVFEALTGKEIFQSEETEITSLLFGLESKTLFVGERNGHVKVFTTTGEKLRNLAASGGSIFALAVSHNGKWLATGGWGARGDDLTGIVTIWNTITGRKILTIPKTGTFSSLAFSADDKRLATTIIDWPNTSSGDISLWDTTSGQEALQLSGAAVDMVFSADGQRLFSVNLDGTLRVWNAGK